VVAEINKKTEAFKGMQVPVKITIKSETKEFTITVGTPPASQLILKEAKVEKASANPAMDQVADLRIEQVIKVAKMKEDALLGKGPKERVKEIVGTCRGMGILVEGVKGAEAIKMINEGKFDKEIASGKTKLSAEEIKELDEEKRKLAHEIEVRRAEFTSKAKSIIEAMKGKSTAEVRSKMAEAGIPSAIAEELISAEKAAAAAAGTAAAGAATAAAPGAKPAAGAAAAGKPAAGGAKK
jgi:large subunit ribosomal protein L11